MESRAEVVKEIVKVEEEEDLSVSVLGSWPPIV